MLIQKFCLRGSSLAGWMKKKLDVVVANTPQAHKTAKIMEAWLKDSAKQIDDLSKQIGAGIAAVHIDGGGGEGRGGEGGGHVFWRSGDERRLDGDSDDSERAVGWRHRSGVVCSAAAAVHDGGWVWVGAVTVHGSDGDCNNPPSSAPPPSPSHDSASTPSSTKSHTTSTDRRHTDAVNPWFITKPVSRRPATDQQQQPPNSHQQMPFTPIQKTTLFK
ncbi:hypothetical protein RIF29_15389 [Crotalaria pallida]|uniref:Uncharacterized protein n=1 Tax=Crotalaria pallida TaxID=3830 RepID=A0AAN9FH52_CROPI